MARSFPPDVLVLDTESVLHARLGRGKSSPRILQAKSYRLPADAFTQAIVTPHLANEGALVEVMRRLRLETGKWDKVSVLLPDSWFRMNILELPTLTEKQNEANEVVRWSLKRTMPIDPQTLRVAWQVLERGSNGVKVLVVSAVETTLAALERVIGGAGSDIVLIEPLGLNIWNAITVREAPSTGDRLFFHIREHDFTTAVFRAEQPRFLRSRNLNGERTLQQEIKLSASYLRESLQVDSFERCFVAGNDLDREVVAAIGEEFAAPVKMVSLSEMSEQFPTDTLGLEAELTACTGVFTG